MMAKAPSKLQTLFRLMLLSKNQAPMSSVNTSMLSMLFVRLTAGTTGVHASAQAESRAAAVPKVGLTNT